MTRSGRIERWLLLSLLALLVGGQLIGLGFGLADNGDFVRTGAWFAPNPVGLEQWVDASDPSRDLRFFDHWLPRWEFDPSFNPYGYFSSALLLWAPGVMINLLFYSTSVLLLPIVSIGARLLLVLFAVALVRWLRRREPDPSIRLLLVALVGVPMVLALIDIEYNVYFNSWYQDGALLVFTLLALGALGGSSARQSTPAGDVVAVTLIGLAATAKASAFYLPVLFLPLLLGSIQRARAEPTRTVLLSAVTVLIAVGALFAADNEAGRTYNSFNSLYNGVLKLSDRPEEHLEALGLAGTEPCIGLTAFTGEGDRCLAAVGDRLGHSQTLAVVLDEPVILARAYALTAREMQITELEYLGKQAPGTEPRSPPAITRVWSTSKGSFFPTGPLLYLFLSGAAVLFAFSLRQGDVRREFAAVGLVAVVGTIMEMGVAFFGDGGPDPKHLLLANVFFDVVALTALGVAVRFGSAAGIRRRAERAADEAASD